MLFKFQNGRSREGIVSVADNVSGVGTRMAARTSGWTTALLSLAKLRLGFMRKYFSR